ncbi:hypothetical protein B0T17DRAFT_619492 [Bombardia bombarda]|uniref:Uncharacterized protein n=1 Tax=Bombardia bombarda TaxID=252184 RepID=A0AA39WI90_9PEZI|nr:hypothetical protein B0T17DRAFT_621718 [Bombardia bombarda]KAK0615895.1 hypothetical protein B0T17DRAFT_619492 [Bombardia bombarda]
MSSSGSSYSASMASPPPPVDLGTYSRSMHQHTKRQMELVSTSSRRSQGGSSQQQSRDTTSAIPNGVNPHRSRNNSSDDELSPG